MSVILLKIASRNVLRNRRRSAIAFSALFFGVFMVILLKGLTLGFATMTTLSVVESRTAAIQIHKKGYFANVAGNPTQFHFSLPSGLLQKLEQIPGVRGVSGRLNFVGQISNGQSQTMIIGTGLDFAREKNVCERTGKALLPGSQELLPSDNNAIAISKDLAKGLALTLAEASPQTAVRTVADSGSSSPISPPSPPSALSGAQPALQTIAISAVNPFGRHNSLDYQVKSVFKAANAYEEKRVVSLALASAQELLALPDEITEIALGLHDIQRLPIVLERVKEIVGPDFEVHTWQEVQPFVRDVLFRQQVGISIISFALLVMVLFLITNTMLMAVFERTREMGTMLALGTRRAQILAIFLWESAILGLAAATVASVVGTLIVSLLGWQGFAFGTAAFEEQMLYPEVSFPVVVATWVVAIVSALVAGTYPALRASKLDPVEALRST